MEQRSQGSGQVSKSRRTLVLGGAAAIGAPALITRAFAAELGTPSAPIQLRVLSDAAYGIAWQASMVPEFNKYFPNIKVTIDPVPYAEVLPKIMLDATAATPTYDVYIVDDPWTPQIAQTGSLLDLRKATAGWTSSGYDWDDFNAAPLAATQWNGVQYGVPLRSNMLLMFTNKSLYKKAGLAAPTSALTWADYLAQAPKLVQDTNGGGKVNAWAIDTYFKRDALTPTIWQAIMNSNGGALLDESNKPIFNGKVGVDALKTHIELLKYAPPGSVSHGYSEALQSFRQGQAATSFMWGSVYRNSAVDPTTTTLTPDQVGLQLLPVGSVSGGVHRGIASGTISAKSKNQEAAWALLQWFSSKEGERWHSSKLGGFPARKSTLASKLEPGSEWLAPVFAVLQQGYDTITTGKMWRVRSSKSDAVQQVLADAVGAAISGQSSAQEALNIAATKVARILK